MQLQCALPSRVNSCGWHRLGVWGSLPAPKHFQHTVTLPESLNIALLGFRREARDEQR